MYQLGIRGIKEKKKRVLSEYSSKLKLSDLIEVAWG